MMARPALSLRAVLCFGGDQKASFSMIQKGFSISSLFRKPPSCHGTSKVSRKSRSKCVVAVSSDKSNLTKELQCHCDVACMICLHDASAHLKSSRTSAGHASTVPPHVNPAAHGSGRQLHRHHNLDETMRTLEVVVVIVIDRKFVGVFTVHGILGIGDFTQLGMHAL